MLIARFQMTMNLTNSEIYDRLFADEAAVSRAFSLDNLVLRSSYKYLLPKFTPLSNAVKRMKVHTKKANRKLYDELNKCTGVNSPDMWTYLAVLGISEGNVKVTRTTTGLDHALYNPNYVINCILYTLAKMNVYPRIFVRTKQTATPIIPDGMLESLKELAEFGENKLSEPTEKIYEVKKILEENHITRLSSEL